MVSIPEGMVKVLENERKEIDILRLYLRLLE